MDEDERRDANVPLLIMTGVTFAAIVGVYAWFAWQQNRVFERALTDLATSRRPGRVTRITPEPSNEEAAADEH